MLKVIIILLFFSFYLPSNSSPKDKIISQMKLTNNLSFNFFQTINDKSEDGRCIIEYPKKIFCEYSNSNKKKLVSNGKSLVIKTSVSYYRYPLERTPLNLILDKNFLINKIYDLEERIIDETYINYTIEENDNKINIFFDNKTFNLVGWQTKDLYQNLNVTHLFSIERNKKVVKNLFTLPLQN